MLNAKNNILNVLDQSLDINKIYYLPVCRKNIIALEHGIVLK